MSDGNPRCTICQGRGIRQTPNGYTTCLCVRGSQTVRDWMRYANSPLDREDDFKPTNTRGSKHGRP